MLYKQRNKVNTETNKGLRCCPCNCQAQVLLWIFAACHPAIKTIKITP